jgi:hypothetical protein
METDQLSLVAPTAALESAFWPMIAPTFRTTA